MELSFVAVLSVDSDLDYLKDALWEGEKIILKDVVMEDSRKRIPLLTVESCRELIGHIVLEIYGCFYRCSVFCGMFCGVVGWMQPKIQLLLRLLVVRAEEPWFVCSGECYSSMACATNLMIRIYSVI